MSTEINKAFVQQFSSNLIRLAQQRGSKLVGTTMKKEVTGKYAHFDRLGATAASKRTSRHGDTPLTDTPHSSRRVSLEDYEVADLIDSQDEVRVGRVGNVGDGGVSESELGRDYGNAGF